jgi:MSHA biogenesis protein MshP
MKDVRGFALVSALFVIVVLSMAVVFMLQVSSVQTATTNLGQLGTQAYYAARGGVEWGVYQAVDSGGTLTPPCNDTMTLDGFAVSVACTTSPHADPSAHYVTVVTAEASRGSPGESEYVTRRVEATVVVPPP